MTAEVKTIHLQASAVSAVSSPLPAPIPPRPAPVLQVAPPVGQARPAPSVSAPVARTGRARRILRPLGSFGLFVGLPAAAAAFYLWEHAQDRYVTSFSFSVRSEQAAGAAGGMAAMMGAGAPSDSGIVADFETSREMLERLEARGLDLVGMYSAPHARDPLFSLRPGAAAEDLEAYWRRVVRVDRDPQTGIVAVKVEAFDPGQSLGVAQAMLDESDKLVEGLSERSRADMTRASAAELERARERLEQSRERLTRFRIENQVVDPAAEMQGRARVLDELRGQLAAALVARANIEAGTGSHDVRLRQADVNISSLRAAIAEEQAGVGQARGHAEVTAGYERLAAEMRMNEEAVRAASSRHDMALQEAARRGAWLVAHVEPHPAERSVVPDRPLWMGFILLSLTVSWLIGGLVRSALRDQQ